MKYALQIFEVRRGIELFELEDKDITIGRSPQCDITLDPLDLTASRKHFIIKNNKTDFMLIDRSKGGTFVNGVSVGSNGRRLYHGDVIEAGNAEITFLILEETKAADDLFEEGKAKENINPAYAIQCYSLALKKDLTNIDIAERLLLLLENNNQIDAIISGGNYFDLENIMQIASNVKVAAPLARAFMKIGDFATAIKKNEKAGGQDSDPELRNIFCSINNQIDGELLKTITDRRDQPFIIQRKDIKVIVDERDDMVDFKYIERYHKYLEQQTDKLYGGRSNRKLIFHVTLRDHLFAKTSPDQQNVLGYFSSESKEIFIRPTRWTKKIKPNKDLNIILLHEYIHFRNDEICAGAWFPRWYDEGIAHVFSGTLRLEDCRNNLPGKNDCIPVSELFDSYFSPINDKWGIAYLQSAALVHFLNMYYNSEKIINVLKCLGINGENFNEAFENTFGFTFDDLDAKWLNAYYQ